MAKKEKIVELEFYGVLYLKMQGSIFFALKVRNAEERRFIRRLWKSKKLRRTTLFTETPLRGCNMFHIRIRFKNGGEPLQRLYVETETQAECLCSLWEAKDKDNEAEYQIPLSYFMGTPVPDAPTTLTWGQILTVTNLRDKLKTADSFEKTKGYVPF